MKQSLVLEGGGMRAAYTAGCLKWLIEHDVRFDNSYGISAGAVLLACYELKEDELLKKITCEVFNSSDFFGLNAFKKEGKYVAYDYMFDDILAKKLKFNPERIKMIDSNPKIGLYDLDKSKCVFYDKNDINIKTLKASCSLPIVSKIIEYKGSKILDGGISKMIPIEQSINDGNQKHLVICTKSKNYVRKKSSKIVALLMKIFYRKYPKMCDDYLNRTVNYYKQMDIVKKQCELNDALLIRPSVDLKNISRFKGNTKDLYDLFNLGYQDMENKKNEIFKIFHCK